MKLSPKGASFIGRHEGFVGRWYLDPVGIPTMGYGFTWRSRVFREYWTQKHGRKFRRGDTISKAEAGKVLQRLVDHEYGAAVNSKFGQRLRQPGHDACCSVTYNLGPGCLKWKWAQALYNGHLSLAASRLMSTGVTARGRRLRGLVRRRKEEADLLQHGRYGRGSYPSIKPQKNPNAISDKAKKRVTDYQRKLTALGFNAGPADGIPGPKSMAAVKAFQIAHKGLANAGILGKATMAQIDRAITARNSAKAATGGGLASAVAGGAVISQNPAVWPWVVGAGVLAVAGFALWYFVKRKYHL